jgi:lipopolysaccharide export system permease protein
MRILDKYILKKFFTTLVLVIGIIMPIGIAIDIAERIDKFLHEPDLNFWVILEDYYQHFIITYANQFLPLALFLAVVIFTSRLANDTEFIAMHSAQISFNRLLYPFFIGALSIAVFSLFMNHFIVPRSNYKFIVFDRKYLGKKFDDKFLTDITLQLGPNDYLFMKSFTVDQVRGSDVVYERYDSIYLKYRLKANSIKFNENDSTYRLSNFKKRYIYPDKDVIKSGQQMDTIFNFFPKDLTTAGYLAKEMKSPDLSQYIQLSKDRGVKNLNAYKVELLKRSSLPFSAFILTMIAVALSVKKKRGGTGMNIAIGIGLAFIYIFFMKITEVLGAVAGENPYFLVWLPNIIFGVLAILFYRNAAKQ